MTGAVVSTGDVRLLHAAVLWLAAGPAGGTRRRVYQEVVRHPGLHQRAVADGLGIHRNLAEHHLRHLERAGLVQRRREGGRVRYFPAAVPEHPEAAVDARHRDALGLLRQERPLHLVAILLTEGPLAMGALARRAGLSAGTATYHVKRLEAAGVVLRRSEGASHIVDVVDRDGLIELLLRYEPPADLVAGFEDLWQDVGL